MSLRTFLLGLSALCIAVAAAYFSITGLSKLFAGASLAVILMASSLEFGKLIAASFLYVYWNKIGILLKVYLSIGITVLIIITSAGIYGFLTSAYQTTADQLMIIDKQVEILQLKRDRYNEQLESLITQRASINTSISDLSRGLSNNVIQYKDQETGQLITTTSSATRRALESQLDDSRKERDNISDKIEYLTDSINNIDIRVIEVSSNNELAAEVGPLKYMAEITGQPMAKIVNWFALFIIFVFDPMAVTLIIAFNTALKYDKESKETKPIEGDKLTPVYKIYNDKTNASASEEPVISTEDDIEYENHINSDVADTAIASTEQIELDEKKNLIESTDENLLERDFSKRPIDVDGDGKIDGWDTNGDGLIDTWSYKGVAVSKHSNLPYYARPDFDWNEKEKWINDQNAVNYWITHRKI